MKKKELKTFIFSQQPFFREGLVKTLENSPDIQIIGQASVTDKILLTVEVMPPDIAIVDLDSPIDSGLSLVKTLKRLVPSVAIIVYTSSPNDEQLFQLISEQVAAYLSKESNSDILFKIIRKVARGDYPISESLLNHPEVIGKIMRQFHGVSTHKDASNLISPLTTREIEVLNYVAQGLANKQIAAKISISEQTIKNHLTSIMSKLNANARTQAVVIAAKKGLITID
ncbi:MAG: response regulator transcription factor [Chloroflexi bacterium]|nr:response regulator transcription factor [Chloroflexota bacterium]